MVSVSLLDQREFEPVATTELLEVLFEKPMNPLEHFKNDYSRALRRRCGSRALECFPIHSAAKSLVPETTSAIALFKML